MTTWTVSKNNLLEVAEVMSFVPSYPGVPSSEFYRVERNKNSVDFLIASVATGRMTLKGEGRWPFKRFFLDRRTFLPFVHAAKEIHSDTPFVFYAKGKQLIIKQGKRKARLDGDAKVSGYGFEPEGKTVTDIKLDKKLKELIYCAREFAPNDPVSPQLACVFVQPNGKGVNLYATNKKVVYSAHAQVKLKSQNPIPFPLYLVRLLGVEQLQSIRCKKKVVSLDFSCGSIWQPISFKALNKFPVGQVNKTFKIAEDSSVLYTVDGRRFARVAKRIGDYLTVVRRTEWILKTIGKKGDKFITMSTDIPGFLATELLQLKKPVRKDFDLSWPLNMLMPFFDYIASNEKHKVEIRSNDKLSYIIGSDVKIGVSCV